MPTYEYKCSACGHRLEEFQSITAKPLRRCPHCGKATLKRLISAGAGLIFKGSGFYQTDYRSDAYKSAAKADAPAAAATPPAGDSKSAPAGDAAAKTKPAPDSAPAKAAPAEPAAKPAQGERKGESKGQKKARGR